MADTPCVLCGGTGWQYAMKSWFHADGLSRLRCGICGGTGSSAYRPDAEYVAFQRRCRARPSPDTTERPDA